MKITADPKTKAYYSALEKKVNLQFNLASKARALGKDVTLNVESPPTLDLADRTENIIGPPGVAKRYRELYTEFKRNRTKAIFQLFKEIIEGDLGDIPDPEQRLEQAVKTGLVLVTEGVVVAPLDGVPKIQISKNPDGSKYVDIYFAGPIRAAGGTATVFPLILGDYARQLMKLDIYKPTNDEIERYVEEINIYDEIVTRQYKLKDDDVRKIIRGCPVCINGEPTEDREVTANADLERIPTNKIRGGMCLVISEGVGLKAMKIMSLAKMLGLNWDWLENVIKMGKGTGKDKEIKPNFNYLSRLAAGRPIFAYPSTPGGFRLRYGRARNTSVMAKGVNPATMFLLDDFMAVGTQTKIERPGKSAEMFPVDTIDGPIVKLNTGEVIRVNSAEEAKKIRDLVKEIIFLGDILITLGDFRKTAHPLIPAGYCEEWWKLEFEKISKEENIKNFDVKSMLENPYLVEQDTAIELSMQLGLPLHPKYLHYYSLLSKDETIKLIEYVKKAEKEFSGNELKKLLIESNTETKILLEKIGLPHKIQEDKLIIEKDFAYSFFKTFGGTSNAEPNKELKACEMLSELSGLIIKDKAGSFIGLRMGRPEAAKPRKMVGDPMVLFPIGDYGGNTRSITKAMESNKEIDANIAYFLNSDTNEIEEQQFSQDSNKRNTRVRKCPKCGAYSQKETCEHCFTQTEAYSKRKIDLIKTVEQATRNLKTSMPPLVKGVKALINADKIPEPLEKGILRARHNLHIFRDATIRYELLNAPLTHFKPKEINLSIEKAHELGYTEDFEGRELVSEEQLCELFPQDMIVHEGAGDFYVKVTHFIDEELERFYGLEKFFNINSPKELIGELFLALAPHTSAAVACRIIGYTKAKLNFAHPYFHLAKRRNCLIGKTPVLIKKNGKIKIIKIEELAGKSKKEEIPLENTYTCTINKEGIIETNKVTSILKQKAPKEIYKIKTKYGRLLELTGDHKLLTLKNNKIITKKVNTLKENESLLSLAKLEVEKELKNINILEWYIENLTQKEKEKIRIHNVKESINKWIKEFGGCWKLSKKINYKNGKSLHTAIAFDSVPLNLFEKILKEIGKSSKHFEKAKISYNKQKSKIPAILPLNKELGEIIGYFLADGYARTTKTKGNEKFVYQINFASAEKSITERLTKNIMHLFNRKITTSREGKIENITLSGRVYYDLFVNIFETGKKAKDKKIPIQIINANKKFITAVLAGYIVGDGHINANCIKTTSVNKNLVNGMSLLCTRINIFPHIYSEKERTINSGIVKDFYKKKEKIIKIKAMGIKIYSQDLLKIGKELFGEKKKKFEKIKSTTKFLKKRTKKIGDFIQDKIKEIKKVKSKTKYVYDLVVEKHKNYIGGFGNIAIYDCDGDQDSIMLLMDALINFSKKYLPSSRGGRMDAPLVFTTIINPSEIDDEVYEVETCKEYPLELYEKSLIFADPELDSIPIIKNKIGKDTQYNGFGFTHSTEIFDQGPKASSYVTLQSMEDKMKAQAKLQNKIRAVNKKDALERVLMSHFLPDIIGNARAFSRQTIRCSKCNTKYRRPPLGGKCTSCGGDHLILTIAQGSVKKYLEIAKNLISKYELSSYLSQRIDLIEKEIDSVFKNDKVQQKNLFEYM